MSPSRAAFLAWHAIVRKGLATRGLADGIVEAFDVFGVDDRAGWQWLVDTYGRVSGFEPLAAAACARFDLVPASPGPRG